MENKINWWLIIAVVIVVAILVSLATVSLTGNSIFSNPVKAIKSTINPASGLTGLPIPEGSPLELAKKAKSGTPKVNSLHQFLDRLKGNRTNNYYTKSEVDEIVANILTNENNTIYAKALILSDMNSPYSDKQAVFNGQGIAVSNVNVLNMSGNGTAYACVDSNGNIFRSSTGCV